MNSSTSPTCNIVSFWLMPSESETALWQPLLDTLADHYNTPQFTPHITVALSRDASPTLVDKQHLNTVLVQVARRLSPLTLDVGPIQTGENFFQCVFARMQTEPVAEIARALARQIETLSPGAKTSPTTSAHLSLLYANIKTAQREMLASQIVAPSPTLVFDRLGAVLPGDGETDFSNPERWELRSQVMLGSGKPPR
ncbi:MAG: hypothetical protein ACRBC3_03265 [Burkholderiaceae bacterium]